MAQGQEAVRQSGFLLVVQRLRTAIAGCMLDHAAHSRRHVADLGRKSLDEIAAASSGAELGAACARLARYEDWGWLSPDARVSGPERLSDPVVWRHLLLTLDWRSCQDLKLHRHVIAVAAWWPVHWPAESPAGVSS